MIVDERIITFINSMDTENSEILETIEQEALAVDVPIIRREMQSFLEVLLLMKKPMRVLEVGTAVGFSALLMSDYLPEGGHITTIENYEKRIPIARENFRRAGKEDKITLIEGDATEVLAEMEGTFDFIFMDAAKGQYTYLGIVGAVENGLARIEQRNKFSVGETIEIMKPDGSNVEAKVLRILNEDGEEQESAPHSKQVLHVELSETPAQYDLLRRQEEDKEVNS